MKKKVKNLSIEEMEDICLHCSRCQDCPLDIPTKPWSCIKGLVKWNSLKVILNKKVRIKRK